MGGVEFPLHSSRNPSMILRLDKKDYWNSGNQHTAKLFQVWDHRTLGNHSTRWNHIVRSSEQICKKSTFPGICEKKRLLKWIIKFNKLFLVITRFFFSQKGIYCQKTIKIFLRFLQLALLKTTIVKKLLNN